MRTMEQVTETLSKTPPVPCDFVVGDTVEFTNEAGIKFSPHKVIGFAHETDVVELMYGRFIYLDYDCYWFPTEPKTLRKI